MKQVTHLFQQLQCSDFQDRYPLFQMDDGKVHVLYIGTYLNGTGYYRHIVPAHELNQTDTHVALLSSLHKWNYNEQFGNNSKNPIIPELISWADYVVIPPLFDEAQYFYQAIRAHSPGVQIVVDIDQNFHCFPKEHPTHSQFKEAQKDILLQNIANADKLLVPTDGMCYFYESLMEKHHPESEVSIQCLPNSLSALAYENVIPIQKNESQKIRIGLIGGNHLSYDFQTIVPVLKNLKDKYQKRIEIILFGWNGWHNHKNLLNGVEVVFEKSVRFTQYFDKLNHLALDIAMLPTQDIYYNTHGRSPVKYFEISAAGIPVVASDLPPFNLVIEDEETGLLAEDQQEWMSQLERLIESPELRRSIGDNALKAAWYKHSYNWEISSFLTQLFE